MTRASQSQAGPGPAPLFHRAFLLLLAANFLQQLSMGAALLLPPFLIALGADRAQVGWLLGLGHVSGLVAALSAGVALDRWGRKPVAILGGVLSAGALAISAALHEPGWLALVQQLLLSAGAAFLLNGYYVWAADILPASRRTEGLCYFGASSLLPLASSYLPLELGFSGLGLRWFFVAASVAVASALPLLLCLREPHRPDAHEKFRWREAGEVLVSSPLRPLWLVTLGFGGAIELFSAFATLALSTQLQGNPATFWLLYSVTAVVLRVLGAGLPERIGLRRTLFFSCIASALAAAAIALARQPAMAVVAGVLGGIAHGYGYPALISLLVGRTPAHLRGTTVSVLDGLWYVTILVLAPTMGSLADWAGRDAIVFELSSGGIVVITVLWMIWERRLRAAPAPRADQPT